MSKLHKVRFYKHKHKTRKNEIYRARSYKYNIEENHYEKETKKDVYTYIYDIDDEEDTYFLYT